MVNRTQIAEILHKKSLQQYLLFAHICKLYTFAQPFQIKSHFFQNVEIKLKTMKIQLKLTLLWVFMMMFVCVQAQVVTDFDETYAQELLKPGTPAPDFQLAQPNGKMLKFSDFAKGKYVVIDFWASWCPDCRKDLPEIIRLYQKYHKYGVEFLGVSFDIDKEKWTSYLEKTGVPYPQVIELKRMN